MEISFNGIGQVAATLRVEDGVEPGMAVVMTDSGTVGKGAAKGLFCGVVLTVEGDGAGLVQLDGMAQVTYSSDTAPGVGWATLACDGKGGVQTVSSGGRSVLVVAVDTEAKTATIKL
jgi:hypothetical protein